MFYIAFGLNYKAYLVICMGIYKCKLVGALTSKPFAFTARSWEVVMVPSVDTYDSFLGSLRLDFRNNDLLRILPLINEELNEEWLTDKARFSYDGLKRQRFLRPYVRAFGPYSTDMEHTEVYFKSLAGLKKLGAARAVSEEYFLSAFSTALKVVKPRHAAVFYGKEVDLETALSARLSLESRFKRVVYKGGDYSNFSEINPDLLRFAINPGLFLSTSSLLLIGSNLRWELPLFNIKIMRRVLAGAMSVFIVAVRSVFSYPVVNLSSNAASFISGAVRGRSRVSLKILNLFVVLSYNLSSYAFALSSVPRFTVGVVFPWASTATLLEVCPSGAADKAYDTASIALSVNSDVLDVPDRGLSLGLLSHGHNAHSKLDFVLPCTAYSESNSHYFNIFRNERYARFGYALSKDILPPWASLAKLFLPRFDTLITLTTSLCRGCFTSVVSKPFENEQTESLTYINKLQALSFGGRANTLFYEVTPNYYRTHYVSRSSKPTSLAAARFSFGLSNFVVK